MHAVELSRRLGNMPSGAVVPAAGAAWVVLLGGVTCVVVAATPLPMACACCSTCWKAATSVGAWNLNAITCMQVAQMHATAIQSSELHA